MRRVRSRPVFLTLWQLHFPWSALASITHRLSGLYMAISIPVMISIFATSVSTEYAFEEIVVQLRKPSFIFFFCWSFGMALIYHLYAGIRHLLMDINLFKSKEWAQRSA